MVKKLNLQLVNTSYECILMACIIEQLGESLNLKRHRENVLIFKRLKATLLLFNQCSNCGQSFNAGRWVMQGEEMLYKDHSVLRDHDFKWDKLAGKINRHVLTCLSNEKGCRLKSFSWRIHL